MQRNWRHSEDYAFTRELSPALWAWQFLRRNPDYRKDYEWFIDTWQALEADYGKAPERDFAHWKLDPRAYAPQEMTQDFCDEDRSCASPDGDQVLIECAMGAKWGFYKFPNSPDIEFPQVPEKLIWREPDIVLPAINAEPAPYEMDIRLDLRLPINGQLELLKQQMVVRRKQISSQGEGWNQQSLVRYLRLLDATGDIATAQNELYLDSVARFEDDALQVKRLLKGGYRLLSISKIR
jgi:hypothetical protein